MSVTPNLRKEFLYNYIPQNGSVGTVRENDLLAAIRNGCVVSANALIYIFITPVSYKSLVGIGNALSY